jgi:hypothetical protein
MDSKPSSRPNREAESNAEPTRPETHGLLGLDGADTPTAPENSSADRQAHSPNMAGPVYPPGPDGADPFDPANLRLTQDFASAVGVRKLLTRVPVDKPKKEWWVRTHPEPEYRLPTGLLDLKEDRETFLVAPALWPALAMEPTFGPRLLVTSITRQGVLFLWPISLPGPDGKTNPWHETAREASELARSAWVRVYADMALGGYRVEASEAIRDNPPWPDLPMREILRVAFRDKMISTWDHPVLQRLRGEV